MTTGPPGRILGVLGGWEWGVSWGAAWCCVRCCHLSDSVAVGERWGVLSGD